MANVNASLRSRKARPAAPQAATTSIPAPRASFWSRIGSAIAAPFRAVANVFARAARKVASFAKLAATTVAALCSSATTQVVATVRATSTKVVAVVRAAARKSVAFAKRATHAVATFARPATSVVGKFWQRALRPFLRNILKGVVVAGVVVAAVLAPWTTLFVGVCGGALVGLALAERLPRWAERVIETLVDVALVVGYAVAAVAALVMAASSIAFAVYAVLYLALHTLQVPYASPIAFAVYCVIGGYWSMLLWDLTVSASVAAFGEARAKTQAAGRQVADAQRAAFEAQQDAWAAETQRQAAQAVSEAQRQARRQADDEAAAARAAARAAEHEALLAKLRVEVLEQDLTAYTAAAALEQAAAIEASAARITAPAQGAYLRAKGTEELWGTSWDAAPVIEVEEIASAPCVACESTAGAMRVDGLCAACVAVADAEDRTLRANYGVPPNAASVEVVLGAAHVAQFRAVSAAAPDEVHWFCWGQWIDARGEMSPREYVALVAGEEAGRVVYDRKRASWRPMIGGRLIAPGAQRDAATAKRIVVDRIEQLINGEVAATTPVAAGLAATAGVR